MKKKRKKHTWVFRQQWDSRQQLRKTKEVNTRTAWRQPLARDRKAVTCRSVDTPERPGHEEQHCGLAACPQRIPVTGLTPELRVLIRSWPSVVLPPPRSWCWEQLGACPLSSILGPRLLITDYNLYGFLLHKPFWTGQGRQVSAFKVPVLSEHARQQSGSHWRRGQTDSPD